MRPLVWWLCSWLSTSFEEMMISSSVGTRSLQTTTTAAAAATTTTTTTAETTTTTYKLEDAKRLVQEAPCSPLNTSLEGELVHLTCAVRFVQPLGQEDPLLSGVPSEQRMGYRLDARMLVFQWEEFPFTKKVGKNNKRDFLYFREWNDMMPPQNTTFFGNGRECKVKNGDRPCYQWIPQEVEPWWNSSGYQLGWQTIETAKNVTAGDYVIPDDVLQFEAPYPQVLQPSCSSSSSSNNNATSGSRRRVLEDDDDDDLPCAPGSGGAHLVDSVVVAWQQLDSNGTMIDYLTRMYEISFMDTISILAVQRGNSFVPWPENNADNKSLLFEFVPDTVSAAQMIESAQKSSAAAMITRHNRVWPWIATSAFAFAGICVRYL